MTATKDLLPDLPPEAFHKQDRGDDADFYVPARLVTHTDEAATRALTDFYRITLPAGGVVLDLMSSWISHLPPDVSCLTVPDPIEPAQIYSIRESQQVSQPVFARYLKTSAFTVEKWETGVKKLRGIAINQVTTGSIGVSTSL